MKIGQPSDKAAVPGGSTGVTSPTSKAATPTRGAANAPIKAGPQQPPVPATPESSAKVELSSAAASLISTQKKSVNPEFDAEKVAAVSTAINNNTYKVNAEAIADKLIANAQEVLGKVAK